MKLFALSLTGQWAATTGGRLYVVVHELGAQRAQQRPRLWRRGLHGQAERWYSVERRALRFHLPVLLPGREGRRY